MMAKFMQYRAFMQYRYLAYTTALAQLLLQIRQFGVLFTVVLGSSVLGIVLLLFLGLGKIIDSSQAAQWGAQLTWLYLFLQCVQLSAMKTAIKNSPGRVFQLTLVKPHWLNIMDIKLLLLSNIWLIASAVIAVDLSFTQWHQVPHFVVFMLLQFTLGLLCLYAMRVVVIGFFISAIWVSIYWPISPLLYYLGIAAAFMLGFFIKPNLAVNRLKVTTVIHFWLLLFIQHSWYLVWRIALIISVFLATGLLLAQRGDLADIVHIIAVAFVVLFCSSLQFDCSKRYQQYRLFFSVLTKEKLFYFSQYMPSLMFVMITLLAFFVLFSPALSVLFFAVFCAVLQQILAHKKPALYALVWLITTGILLAWFS